VLLVLSSLLLTSISILRSDGGFSLHRTYKYGRIKIKSWNQPWKHLQRNAALYQGTLDCVSPSSAHTNGALPKTCDIEDCSDSSLYLPAYSSGLPTVNAEYARVCACECGFRQAKILTLTA